MCRHREMPGKVYTCKPSVPPLTEGSTRGHLTQQAESTSPSHQHSLGQKLCALGMARTGAVEKSTHKALEILTTA